MTNKKMDWNNFWDNQGRDYISALENPQNWSELIWKIGLESWHEKFKNLAPGNSILECGCGMATLSQYMTMNGFDCTMLDYSASSLERAEKAFEFRGLPGHFINGDINNLPFDDEQFDIVYSGGVLEFFDNIEQPIKEMVRVLKPGGVFAAHMVPRKFSIQSIADVERTLAHSLTNLFRGRFSDVFKVQKLIPKHYQVNKASLDDYLAVMRSAGLKNVVGRYVTPFPTLALPNKLSYLYMQFLKSRYENFKSFEESGGKWKRWIGISYSIVGIKE